MISHNFGPETCKTKIDRHENVVWQANDGSTKLVTIYNSNNNAHSQCKFKLHHERPSQTMYERPNEWTKKTTSF